MARYARGIMLVMCMLLSSLPRATIAETEEEINQLFLRARSFEDNKDHLLAMRTHPQEVGRVAQKRSCHCTCAL
jgi:hypothetical protein